MDLIRCLNTIDFYNVYSNRKRISDTNSGFVITGTTELENNFDQLVIRYSEIRQGNCLCRLMVTILGNIGKVYP